ncbi:MAG TPA: hypothetical protein VNX68_15725 [Nitrosopumilaceae archaeon]|jgi:hypothetical protein|nr:hypothetical protein [Nitrosopumilaceae archaeon]
MNLRDGDVFFICAALVIMTLILTVGFGQCEQSGGMEVYKVCMKYSKDTAQCKDPYAK